MTDLRQTIEDFLLACREPALAEPGEEMLALTAGHFALDAQGPALSIEAWNEKRSLVRRVTGIERQSRGKLVLTIERFAKRAGTLALVDLAHPAAIDTAVRTRRLEFREQFRLFLCRQFPRFQIARLTTEPDLEHTLSPAYPRALLRQGSSAWAAIGASPGLFHSQGVLTFGLIWLDYLRRQAPDLTVQGLILYLPAGLEKTTCLRLLFLNPASARYAAFVYGEDGEEAAVDLADYGNFDTHLDACPASEAWPNPLLAAISEAQGVETVGLPDGERSLRVHGMEFARTRGADLLFGLDRKRALDTRNAGELHSLAANLVRLRSASAPDRRNPLYARHPEAWLESQVRNAIEQIDAGLVPSPVYGQVHALAAANRGVLDLLAVERGGRLAVLELKASEDVHLPLQALDYWMRVKWHLDRGEFAARGYFPGVELSGQPPRLLLVSPALDFHPSNETALRYFSPAVPVERVGVGLEWRKELKVMLRS